MIIDASDMAVVSLASIRRLLPAQKTCLPHLCADPHTVSSARELPSTAMFPICDDGDVASAMVAAASHMR